MSKYKIKWFSKLFSRFMKPEKIDLKYRRVDGKKHEVYIDVYVNDVFKHTVKALCMGPKMKTISNKGDL